MPDKKEKSKSLFEEIGGRKPVVDPNTGVEKQVPVRTLMDEIAEKGLKGVPAEINKQRQSPTIDKSTGFNPNEKAYEYISDPKVDDPNLESRSNASQPGSDVVGRMLKQFGAGIVSGFGQSLLSSGDIEQSVKSIYGAEDEYNTNFLGISTSKLKDWHEGVIKNNPIYQRNPNKVDPGDPAWWANHLAQTGFSAGIGIEALAETAAIGAVSGGIGEIAAIGGELRKLNSLSKLWKAANTSEKLRRSATTFGLINRHHEGIMEARDVFDETYTKLKEEGKFTDEKAKEIAAKAASVTYRGNLPLMALDALTFRTMTFNPVTRSSTNLVEKALGKIGNKTVRNVTAFGFGSASEAAEEMAQYVAAQEGLNYGDLLAGHKTVDKFGERLQGYLKTDDIWNAASGGAIGGVVLGGMFKGYASLMGGKGKRQMEAAHAGFVNKISAIGLELNQQINDAEEANKPQLAESLRAQMGIHKALTAVHLDALTDKTTGYDSYSNFLKQSLKIAESGDAQKIADAQIPNVDFVKANFPKYLADAEKIKELYDQAAEHYNQNDLVAVVPRHYQIDRITSELPLIQAEMAVRKLNSQYSLLSPQGQNASDISHERLILEKEIERITKSANKADTSAEKENYESILSNMQSRIRVLDEQMSGINADDTYTLETRNKDGQVLEAAMLNKPYLDSLNDAIMSENELAKLRAELKYFNDPKHKTERLKNAIREAQTVEEVDKAVEEVNAPKESRKNRFKDFFSRATRKKEEQPLNDTQVEPESEAATTTEDIAKDKKDEILTNATRTEATTPTTANTPFGNITNEEVAKPEPPAHATQVTSALEAATSPFGKIVSDPNLPTNEPQTNGNKPAFTLVPDPNLSLSPSVLKDNLDDDTLNSLKTFTKEYVDILGEEMGVTPTFEDYIRDYIKTYSREQADKYFNAMAKGWELNGLTPTDFSKVYNNVFRSKKEIAQGLTDVLNSMVDPTEETKRITTQQVLKENPSSFDEHGNKIYEHSGYTTAEKRPKIAILSRLASETAVVKEDGTVNVSHEYTETELNKGQYVNSLPVLDPDSFIEGTELEAHVPGNFMEIIIPIYTSDGGKGEAISFGEYIGGNNPEGKVLTPDMQEYKDKVPIIIYPKGKSNEKGIAFVHDIGWYHPRRFTELKKHDIDEPIRATREIRDAVLSGNNLLTITSKRTTTFEGLIVDDPKKDLSNVPTLAEANPQAKIAVANADRTLMMEDGQPFDSSKARLANSKPLSPGTTYHVVRYGRDEDGTPTYMAYPVSHPKLTPEDIDTVIEAIGIYMDSQNPAISSNPTLLQRNMAIVERIRTDLGIDILRQDSKTTPGIGTFISQYMILFNPGEAKTTQAIKAAAQAHFADNLDTYFISIVEGNIHIGNASKKLHEKYDVLSIGPNMLKDSSANRRPMVDGILNRLKTEILPTFGQSASKKALAADKPLLHIKDGQVTVANKSYREHLKGTLKVTVKSYNIGTQDNPNYITNIQPIITYDLTSNLNKSQEVAKAITPESTEELTEDKLNSDEAIQALFKQAEEDLNYLSDEDNFSLSPVTMNEDQVKATVAPINRIAGLTPSQQYYLIDYMFNQIQGIIDFDNVEVIPDNEISNKVRAAYDDIINKERAYRENQIAVFQSLDKEKYPNAENIIRKYQLELDKIKAIDDNYATFEKAAVEKIKKYTGITEIENPNAPEPEDSNEEDFSDDPELQEADEMSAGSDNYSKNALTEDGKASSSYRLKRFFAGISQKIKNGDVIKDATSFLNFPTYVGFDTVYNTVSALVADQPADFETMLAKLEESSHAYLWIPQLIEKLRGASQQIQNEFVSTMNKHSLSMEFVMYSYNRDKGTYSLRIYNTNANAIVDVIKKDWFVNFKASNLVIPNAANGTYTINKQRAQHLLDVFNGWTKTYAKLINSSKMNAFRSQMDFLATSKGKGGSMEINPVDTNLVTELKEKLKTSDDLLEFSFGDKEYVVSQRSNKYYIKEKTPSTPTREAAKEWLQDFGIRLSDETMDEIYTKGYYHSDSKARIPFSGMFSNSASTVGIFGILANQLGGYINNPDTINIEEEGGNPLNQGLVKTLASLEAKYNAAVISNSFRDNGKSIYGYTANKFVTDRKKELRRDDSNIREQLGSISFSKGSMWLEMLENPAFRNKFDIIHLGLTALKETGKTPYSDNGIAKLSAADHELDKLGFFQPQEQGETRLDPKKFYGIPMRLARMFSLTMSDKDTMTLVKTAVLDLTDQHFNEDMTPKDHVLRMIYDQTIKPELERMVAFHKGIKKTNIKAYDKGASLFMMMPAMNTIKVKDAGDLLLKDAIKQAPDLYTIEKIEAEYMAEINKMLAETVTALTQEKVTNWKTYGLVNTDNTTKFLDSKYLKSRLVAHDEATKKRQIDIAASDFVINSLIANANSFMLFAGDPAVYYKTDAKRENFKTEAEFAVQAAKDSFVNVGKRLANQIAPGTTLSGSEGNRYLQVFIEDRKSSSDVLAYKERLLGKEGAAAYASGIEAADAQEYTTWKEHLYILEKMGRTPDVITDITAQDIIEAREIFASGRDMTKLTDKQKKLITKVAQPIKPVYTGQIYDKDQDVMRTVYIKSSSFPLIPQLTSGFKIDKLRTEMEALENDGRGMTVRASYQSANKVGALSNPVKIWDKDGNIISDFDLKASSMVLDRKNFRIQQDVPYKSAGKKYDAISLGTQTMKLLFGDGIMSIDGFDYNGKPIHGKELYKEYNKVFINLIENAKNSLYEELGISTITHNPIDVKATAAKLQALLYEEAGSRGYSRQAIEGLELDENGKFLVPLWSAADSNKYESLLNAIVTNRVVKMKLPGTSYVMGSEEGFSISEDLSTLDQSKVVFTSKWTGSLKPAHTDEAGVFHKAQVLVPSKFRDNKGNLIDLFETDATGKYKYVNKTTQGFRIKEGSFDESLLQLTAFRIPTSGHGSMSQVDIVGFIPTVSGDLMFAPKDFTKQMGLDFDVDKMPAYQLHHYQTKDGKFKEYKSDKTSGKDYEKQLQNEIIKIHAAVLSHPSDEVQSKINRVLSTDYAEGQAAFIDGIKSQDTNSTFTPLSDEYQMNKLISGASGKLGTGAYSLDVVGHALFQQALLSQEPIQFTQKDEFGQVYPKTFVIGRFSSDGVLGNINTLGLNGQIGSRTIAEVLAERQNIAVDNEKLQVMGRVNLNDLTMDADKVMNLLGFDKGEDGNSISMLLLSQPIIVDYVKMMKNASSNISEYNPKKEEDVIQALMSKYIAPFVPNSPLENGPDLLTNDVLVANLTQPDPAIQRNALVTFLDLKKYGEKLRAVQTTINTDSKGLGKSFFDVTSKMTSIAGLGDNTYIANVDALIGEYRPLYRPDGSAIYDEKHKNYLLNEGYVEIGDQLIKPSTLTGAFNVHAVKSAYALWSDHFPYDAMIMKMQFDELISVMDKQDAKETKKVVLKQEMLREMKKFMYTYRGLGLFTEKAQTERAQLFMDTAENTSLAKYIKELRSIVNTVTDPRHKAVIKEFIVGNKLIARMEMDVNTNGRASTIKFNNAAGENFDEDYLGNSLAEMIEKEQPLPDRNGKPYNTRLLAQELIAYSYLQGGIQQAVEFVKYVPIAYLKSIGFADLMGKMNFNAVNYFDLNPQRQVDSNGKIRNPHLVSRATMQIAQHNPQKMPSRTAEWLIDNMINPNSQDISSLETFQLPKDEKKDNPVFISVYNPMIPKGEKKYQLYYFDGTRYVRVPVLGQFGMSEYSREEEGYPSLVNQKVKAKPLVLTTTVPNTTIDPNVKDVFGLQSGNQPEIFNSIINNENVNPEVKAMAQALIPFIDPSVKIQIGDVFKITGKPASDGIYSRDTHTVTMNTAFVNKNSDSAVAKIFLHEIIHGMTVRFIEQYTNIDGTIKPGAPQIVHQLSTLFLDAQEALGGAEVAKKNFDNIIKAGGIKNKEEAILYGVSNIKEFITALMTEPEFQKKMNETPYRKSGMSIYEKFKELIGKVLKSIGVDLKEGSIAADGINVIFELLEFKKEQQEALTQDSFNPFGSITDEDQQLMDDVDDDQPPFSPTNLINKLGFRKACE